MFRHFAGFVFLIFFCFPAAAQCPITVSAGPDVVKCGLPATTQLSGSITGSYLSFAWTPTTGMTNSTTLTPTVNPTTTTTYTLTATALDASINLIDNGDFEAGNAGFSSDYTYSPGDLYPEGVYDVLTNPSIAHPDFPACSDHTTGAGNMMAINGASSPGTDVWCQTVTVSPNTQYVFTAWATSLVSGSPARLQFSINGTTIGSIFNVSSQTCNWQNFYAVWNSGTATSATICIVNQNTAPSGNDFAIDDIVFSPTCRVMDMVQVEVVNIKAMAAATTVTLPCQGASVNLNGAGSSVGPGIMYDWTTVGGNIVSGENTLNPVVDAPGAYTLRVSFVTASGEICEKFVTVNVFYNTNPLTAIIVPPAQLGCGVSTVTLVGNATPSIANVTWQWSVVGNGNIVGSTTNKNAIVNQPGLYQLTATNNLTGCTSTALMPVTAENSLPVSNATSDSITCVQSTAALSGAGSSTGAGIGYQWSTPNGTFVGATNTLNAVAGTAGTYILAVTNTSNGCVVRDTVVVISNTTLPYAQIDPPPNIDCDSDTVELFVHLSPPPFVLLVWTAENGGNIASGQYTPQPSITAPGTYILQTVDPINGCVSVDTVGVISNFTPPVAASLPADSLTCQQTTVTLSGTGSSEGFNFGYEWTASNGGNIVMNEQTLSPQVNAPGLYTLTVLNFLNGCTATSTVSVAADTNAVTAVTHANDTLNCSTLSLTITTNGSSAGTTFVYDWSTVDGNILGPDDTPGLLVSAPGVYELTLTNTANGCSATSQAEVLQDIAPPAVLVAVPNQLTCAVPVQSVTATPLTPGVNYTYAWTAQSGGNIVSPANTASINVNAAGTYQLVVSGVENGCTAIFSAAVTQEAGVPVVIANAPGPLTCVVTNQTLSTSGSSTGNEYVYSWSATDGGNIFSGETGPSPVVDAPGTYILQILNQNNGCSGTDTVAVLENILPPVAEAGPGGVLTCADTEFILTGNENLPVAGLTFSWSTDVGNFTSDPNNALTACDEAGTYVLLVLDNGNGCTASDTLVMSENKQAPDLDVTPPFPLTCMTTSINLAATASGSTTVSPVYHWQTVDGNIVSGDSTLTPLVNEPGTYALTVTDPANGCSTTGGALVFENITPPAISIQPAGTLTCAVTAQLLEGQNQAGGIFTYQWSASNGGSITSGDTTLMPTVDEPGQYLLTAINVVNGCQAADSLLVLQNIDAPLVDAGLSQTLNCLNNSLTISGTASGQGSLTLQWTAETAGSITSGDNTLSPTVNAEGWYTLLVTDGTNGCQAADSVQVFQDANIPSAEAGQPALLTCATTQLALQGSGSTGNNYSYLWTTPDGNLLGDPASLNPMVDEPGTYLLAVTNALNGCSSLDSVLVLENLLEPDLNILPAALLTCTTVSLQLAAQTTIAGGMFNWSDTQGGIVSGETTASPVINLPGIYSAVLTDPANGCSSTESIMINSDTAPPVIAAITPAVLTCEETERMLNGSVLQPAANYSVHWTTIGGAFVSGANTLTPTVSQTGTYQMNVLDQSNGCNAFVTVALGEDVTPPTAAAGSVDPITCDETIVSLHSNGSSTGPNFTYAWDGPNIETGAESATPEVSGIGTYTITVTNLDNGCMSTATATVIANTTPPVIAIATPTALTCVRDSVVLNTAGSSQGPGFLVSWTTDAAGHFVSGQNSWSPVVDAAATYTLTIENTDNGCTSTQSIGVIQNIAPPGVSVSPAENLNCNRQEIDLEAGSSAPNAGFFWTTADGQIISGAQSGSPTIVAPGLYQVLVTNPVNGCTSIASVTVGEVFPPEFEPIAWQPDCHVRTGAIDFGAVSAGNAPFQYSINAGQSYQNGTSYESLDPGIYELVVQDNDGCTAVETIEITAPFFPELTIEDLHTLALGESVPLVPVINMPQTSVASWEWLPADGLSCADCPDPIAKPVKDQTYTLIIRDLNGCTAQAQTLLRVNTTRVLYPPNVISPNGDGKGDFFNLFGKGVEDITWLRIYDRWGNQLYDVEHLPINEEMQGWNGIFRGQPVNPGVFVWQAMVKFIDGVSELFSGDITVVR